jgi:hypothetical protein
MEAAVGRTISALMGFVLGSLLEDPPGAKDYLLGNNVVPSLHRTASLRRYRCLGDTCGTRAMYRTAFPEDRSNTSANVQYGRNQTLCPILLLFYFISTLLSEL